MAVTWVQTRLGGAAGDKLQLRTRLTSRPGGGRHLPSWPIGRGRAAADATLGAECAGSCSERRQQPAAASSSQHHLALTAASPPNRRREMTARAFFSFVILRRLHRDALFSSFCACSLPSSRSPIRLTPVLACPPSTPAGRERPAAAREPRWIGSSATAAIVAVPASGARQRGRMKKLFLLARFHRPSVASR